MTDTASVHSNTTATQPPRERQITSPPHEHITPFSASFTDKRLGLARSIYFKALIGGTFALTIVMFAVFSIYWGALWKTPAHALQGWVVDFDQSNIGNAVSQALIASSATSKTVTWKTMSSSDFPGGNIDVANKVVDEKVWVAVVINSGATNALNSAVASANSNYNGSSAVTVYGNEARSENAFRSLVRPTVQGLLESTAERFASQFAQQIAANSSSNSLQNLLSNAPQVITRPIGYTVDNLRPFDVPVATAITFVGLIYLLILSFFIVMIGVSARDVSGLEKHLTTGSLIRLRMASVFTAYFFLSLFYSLLSKAFQVDFSRKFGTGGFVVFWMLNYIGMLAVGLALEAMITLLTVRFIPFFMIVWIITNVSVCFMPIEVLPRIYHYGYATPFYNVSKAIRTILFSTKNHVGLNFGVLFAWVAISCITLPLFQWFMRRRKIDEVNHQFEPDEKLFYDLRHDL
ncbi:hypothetical protein V5O48_009150 [Marasmius crinis-equi]|uniref:DUF3533 domain-containing protein n=1 Tax=Marasmius crinis-equi TaxID=585013 RepID=A0ABR3FC37_9AGAR